MKKSVLFLIVLAMFVGVMATSAEIPKPQKVENIEGKVTSVSVSSLSVQTEKSGTVTLAIHGDTVIRLKDKPGGLPHIKVGGCVLVSYLSSAGGPSVARSIIVIPPKTTGQVGHLTSAGFTMTSGGDQEKRVWNVVLNEDTLVTSHGYPANTIDIKPKCGATVEGLIEGMKIQAISIALELPTLRGVVQSVTDGHILMKQEGRDPVKIAVGDLTTITLVKPSGPTRIGLPSIQPGMTIAAGGHPASDRAMTAVWVEVSAPSAGQK